MDKLTIYDIAKKANVSIATISRAINPTTRSKVAPDTLNRIEKLITESGYTPNLAARKLGGTALKTIGVLLPHFSGIFFSDYYSKVLSGVSDALLDSSYQFKLIMLKQDEEHKWDSYDFHAGESVDALVVTHLPNFFANNTSIEKMDIPCVVINDPAKDIKAHFAYPDNAMGGYLAAEHLYQHGHRDILILAGPRWSSDSNDRIKGFKSYFKSKSLNHDFDIAIAHFQEDRAYAIVEDYFKSNPKKVTAIFACNDLMALGAMKKLEEMNIRCPQDISIIGFDDDLRSAQNTPALTTVRVPLYELTKAAVLGMIDYLESGNKNFIKQSTCFPVELVIRQSVLNR